MNLFQNKKNQNKLKISIVGVGAVGLAVINLISRSKICHQVSEINLIEKNHFFGQGLAYQHDVTSNLLNREARFMSIDYFSANNFVDWLNGNRSYWAGLFSQKNFCEVENLYLPRSLFGLYLTERYYEYVAALKSRKILVRQIPEEAMNIIPRASDYSILLKSGLSCDSDIVILAIGNLVQNNYAHFAKIQNFINSAYPTNAIIDKVRPFRKIGILGSKLTAVDVAISIIEAHPEKNIKFISRSAMIPVPIVGSVRKYTPKYFDEKALRNIRETTGKIALADVFNLLKLELGEIFPFQASTIFEYPRPSRKMDILRVLNSVVYADAERALIFKSFLVACNKFIDYIWLNLSEEDKTEFIEKYYSIWLYYRIGIPIQTYNKIKNFINELRIGFTQAGQSDISHDPATGEFCILSEDNFHIQHAERFDCLINATGVSHHIRKTDSALLANLLTANLIKSNRWGGLSVNQNNLQIENSIGCRNIFALGNPTFGSFLFVNSLERNVQHAKLMVEHLEARYEKNDFAFDRH